MNELLGLAALILLVLLAAAFVAAEYALVSVRRARIDQLAESGNGAAQRARRVLGDLDLHVTTVQLGATAATVGLGFVAGPVVDRLLRSTLVDLGLSGTVARGVTLGLAFALAVGLHFVVAAVVAKSAALQRSEPFTLGLTRAVSFASVLLRPVLSVLRGVGAGVLRLWGLQPVTGHHTAHSEEEIRMIVSASSQEGVLEDDEKELVYNVFDLSDTQVRSIMTPRVDMVMVPAAYSLRQLLTINQDHGYSRVPVYNETADDIIGVVHMGDVLRHLHELDHVTVGDVSRPTLYTPESMRVSELLKTMRERKTHLGVVIDEFGGTAGLVTLEDVLEEIVGEIYDETDEEEEIRVQALEDGVYLLEGSLGVDEVEDVLGIELDGDEELEFDTLAGFVTQHFGYIPDEGEHFAFGGWEFRVEVADQRRVTRVRATRVPSPTPLIESESEPAYDG